MPLLTLQDAELAYGDFPLLDRASLSLEAGERLGLIGRNGTGKSSLLGVIAGRIPLDDGELRRREGLSIALVEQEPALPGAPTLKQSLLARAAVPQEHKLDKYLDLFGIDPGTSPAAASGGERKRAALALAFALEPELLLLDEPTNHLDIEGIVQLENLLLKQPSVIVITHDRAFLDRVATRILELDRGALRSYPGNFSDYEKLKSAQMAVEAVVQRKFDRFWAQEEAWIRKGIEARRTRNEGRVRRLERLRAQRAARREQAGALKLAIGEGQRSGKLVCELINVTKTFGHNVIARDVNLILSRGDRLGLIGPNGAGKTTLLRLILGTLPADSGEVRLGANVNAVYFDQMREGLDPDKTVAESVEGTEKHVISYLSDFLFPPRRASSPVRMLSGGERNRLLLARLFARPANVLVLDEPTNDLDIESLELLEAALQDYAGTLLLVSHDRAFLDNVVTQTLVAEGDGVWKEYAGGYSDYLVQRTEGAKAPAAEKKAVAREKVRTKLSYKETRELEALPGEIEALEAEQQALFARMHAADYYRQPPGVLRADQQRTAEIEALLMEKLERWETLEARARV